MSDAKACSTQFEGRPCKDGDFHLIVDRKTFELVSGREPIENDKAGSGKYRLYPEDWAGGFRGTRKVKVKLSVQPL